ncbi:hypothetical protein AB5I41_14130 [Sphingomonas sp. MMS24-JH45]
MKVGGDVAYIDVDDYADDAADPDGIGLSRPRTRGASSPYMRS